ncbi:MAG: GNAT family N-acetyltransferase, partial [Anaerolineae bacterium]|nr:GNAT family N-acetyltransferase [Anaerolineae bacterium]
MLVQMVDVRDEPRFREMAEAYWRELMPRSAVVQDAERGEAYFRGEFAWNGGNRHPYWALVDGCPIGFVSLEVFTAQKRAFVDNFYVVPEERRRGYGTAMVAWLFSLLDDLGVEQIDLNVRRDNPAALAFWQA